MIFIGRAILLRATAIVGLFSIMTGCWESPAEVSDTRLPVTAVSPQKVSPAPVGGAALLGNAVVMDNTTAALAAYLQDDQSPPPPMAPPSDDGTRSGAVYVFEFDGGTQWLQQAMVTPSDPHTGDKFGNSIAIQADTLVVGAYNANSPEISTGAVYIFSRSGVVWSELSKLSPPSGTAEDWFGSDVAIDGTTIAIGTPGDDDGGENAGAVYIYTLNGGVWSQQKKLSVTSTTADLQFGQSLALDGDLLAVGAPGVSGGGRVYVFQRTEGFWSEVAQLDNLSAMEDDQQFGGSLALSGHTLLIGARGRDVGIPIQESAGAAFVYTVDSNGVWTQQQELHAGTAAAWDLFGSSVTLQGNLAVIGATEQDENGDTSGNAYVFSQTGGVWTEEIMLLSPNVDLWDWHGSSVSLDNDRVVVGAMATDGGDGAAHFFRLDMPNVAPTANISGDQQLSCAPVGGTMAVPLDGRDSSDANGDALLYTWTKDGMTIATGPTPTVDLPAGTHEITLTVSDALITSAPASTTVTVIDYDRQSCAVELADRNNWTSPDQAYTTVTASGDGVTGSCTHNGPTSNRWFKFQATTTYADVSVLTGGNQGTMQYPYLTLWDEVDTELGCSAHSSSDGDLNLTHNALVPGQWYYVSVDNHHGVDSYKGSFAMHINDQPPMDYDRMLYALELTDLNSWTSPDAAYTTEGATPDESKGSCWHNGPNNNRWFKFQAVTNYVNVEVHTGATEGTMQYPYLALWDAGSSELACAKFVDSSTDILVSYDSLTPGEWYYISVDNHNDNSFRGSFGLSINGQTPLDYDLKGSAIEVATDNWASIDAQFTTIGATPDESKGSCWINGPNYNRWFKFQATTDYIDVTLRTGGTEGTLQYPYLALWDAGSSELTCAKFTDASADIKVTTSGLIPGEWYYIAVDNHGSTSFRGSFSLSIRDQAPQDYDDWNYAIEMTDLNSWYSGDAAYTTALGTADGVRASCWNSGPNYNRWFKFQATTNQIDVTMHTGANEGTLEYAFLALWDAVGTELACDRFVMKYSDLNVQGVDLTPGEWYYISVDNFVSTNYWGSFALSLTD